MKLEDLVPPLNLCKKIPAGEFEGSALIWMNGSLSANFDNFDNIFPPSIQRNTFPAPTLQEIMAELPPTDSCVGYFCIYKGDNEWSIGDCELDLYVKNGTESSNPAASALKVWLKLKGIE